MKLSGSFLTLALLTPNFSQAIELKGVLSSNRILTEGKRNPSKVEVFSTQRCGGPTQELVLAYDDMSVSAAQALGKEIKTTAPAFAPCETRAFHDAGGRLLISFAYKSSAGQRLKHQVSSPNGIFTIDHWWSSAAETLGESKRDLASQRASRSRNVIQIENLNDLAKIKDIELRTFAVDDFPYRDTKVERDILVKSVQLKTEALLVPLAQLAIRPIDVEFTPQELPYKEFLLGRPQLSKALNAQLDAIFEIMRREDWIRAAAAHDVLLRSELRAEYQKLGLIVPAIDGYLKIRAAQSKDGTVENMLFSGGINVWREALLKSAISATKSDPFLDFMFLESLRHLYLQKDFYTGLAMIDETRAIPWSPMVKERSDYLQGVALLSLGMFQKARGSFSQYLESRKSMNIRDVADRRLLPSAAFRLADVDFVTGDYAGALKSYEKAMLYLPGSQKVNFEGYLYPKGLVAFPAVLFNMAEAHIRRGEYAKALKRLRALIAFDVSGQSHGIAMFRIPELLSRLGADPEKVLSIFRECSYRYSGYFSGAFCDMHVAARDEQYQSRRLWPRLESIFSQFENKNQGAEPVAMKSEDRRMYSALLKSKFYMDRGKPLIALSALDQTRDLESSKYLKDWNYEFSASAFLGVQRELLGEGDFRAVVQAYEKRQKTLFLYLDRPQVILAVANAYTEQGLWREAERVYARATELKELVPGAAFRMFDFSAAEWAFVRAKFTVGLYGEGKASRSDVQVAVSTLDDAHLPSLLLLISYAQKAENLKLEINAWNRYSQKFNVDWKQLRSYSSALLKAGEHKALRTVLEKYVGAWFYERDKASVGEANASAPDSVLVLRLAEARVRDGALESAVRVFDYLESRDPASLDVSTPKEMILYSRGKALASKKEYAKARQSFDAATALAPASIWGRLAATESQEIAGLPPSAQAR